MSLSHGFLLKKILQLLDSSVLLACFFLEIARFWLSHNSLFGVHAYVVVFRSTKTSHLSQTVFSYIHL